MKSNFYFFCILSVLTLLLACGNNNQKEVSEVTPKNNKKVDSAFVNGTLCDIKLPNIHFTKSINGADTLAKADANGKVIFRAGEKKDYFSDPNGELSNNTAPILLSKVDNTKPFTLISKVTPEFTEKGLYNAGVLYIYVNDNFYQKFCFEQ
ncbi:hypothetical protein DBR27_17825, partial [Flavobacterium sp. HMWF030]